MKKSQCTLHISFPQDEEYLFEELCELSDKTMIPLSALCREFLKRGMVKKSKWPILTSQRFARNWEHQATSQVTLDALKLKQVLHLMILVVMVTLVPHRMNTWIDCIMLLITLPNLNFVRFFTPKSARFMFRGELGKVNKFQLKLGSSKVSL